MAAELSVIIFGLLMAIVMPKPARCAVLEEGEMGALGLGKLLSEVQYEMRRIELSKLLIAELVQAMLSKEKVILLDVTRIHLHKCSMLHEHTTHSFSNVYR